MINNAIGSRMISKGAENCGRSHFLIAPSKINKRKYTQKSRFSNGIFGAGFA
jgi:hypothetical protein